MASGASLLTFVLAIGCAAPVRLFPPVATALRAGTDEHVEHRYDVDGDGQVDYAEVVSNGRVRLLRYDDDQDGAWEAEVDLDTVRRTADERSSAKPSELRHLVLILDSIPYAMVADLQRQGRLLHFAAPSRVVAPFPVMTDPSMTEFFSCAPCPAVEAEHYDGEQLVAGHDWYMAERNAPWYRYVDYYLPHTEHGWAYLFPGDRFEAELRDVQRHFLESDRQTFVAYLVSTSSLGSQRGRNGHQVALILLDRFCRRMMYETRGHLQITLLSDHGHNLRPSRRISLRKNLERSGYRIVERLNTPSDLVVPEFGQVSVISLYAQSTQVAADAVGFDGVELAAYRDGERVVVRSRAGRARIERRGDAYRYLAEVDDPLQLKPIAAALQRRGLVDADGFAQDDDWFAALHDHVYPDALQRLWRAFDGLFEHSPTVLLSLEEGVCAGSADLAKWIQMASVHGNLRAVGSYAFVMSTAGRLPRELRMRDIATQLQTFGLSTRRSVETSTNE